MTPGASHDPSAVAPAEPPLVVAVAPDRDLRPAAIARGWRILDDPPGSAP
ncbi:MAG TPA: hypothetical protein VER83_02585 [Candidatus Nanopelagicales bacterium]|nr:hypothetical protein [Candidatus Nanopelagicales bacterium]